MNDEVPHKIGVLDGGTAVTHKRQKAWPIALPYTEDANFRRPLASQFLNYAYEAAHSYPRRQGDG